MSVIVIPCPECGRELRLRDRKLLGRRGKCPKCEHRFMLEEPDEVAIQPADAPVAVGAAQAAVGTSAKYVPDESAAAASPFGNIDQAAPAPGASGVEKMQEIRRKKKQQNKVVMISIASVLVFGLGGLWAAGAFSPAPIVKKEKKKEPKEDIDFAAEVADAKDVVKMTSELRPTNGRPISLQYAQWGTSMVVHLRPAEMWGSDPVMAEFMVSTLNFGTDYLEPKIKELTGFEPSELEEVTFCISMGQKGSPPSVTTICTLVKKIESKVELILGKPKQMDLGYPYFDDGDRILVFGKDLKTIVRAPKEFKSDVIEGISGNPGLPADDINELLPNTDRTRHMTVMFIPDEVYNHHEVLVGDNIRKPIDTLLTEITNDVKAVSWSMHIGDKLHSEIYFRNNPEINVNTLQRNLRRVWNYGPEQILAAIKYMEPATVGEKKIIGRYPAMTKAFSLATVMGVGNRFVQATTILPERATSNLTLGTLLTLNQAALTDFSGEVPVAAADANLPKTVAGRLQLPVLIEFSRTPLQEAFAYIAEEASLTIEIDGDALKGGGYTKNMAQTFTLGEVPALDGIKKILSNYQSTPDKPDQQMCIVVDEEKKVITITTQKFAADQSLKPHPFIF